MLYELRYTFVDAKGKKERFKKRLKEGLLPEAISEARVYYQYNQETGAIQGQKDFSDAALWSCNKIVLRLEDVENMEIFKKAVMSKIHPKARGKIHAETAVADEGGWERSPDHLLLAKAEGELPKV